MTTYGAVLPAGSPWRTLTFRQSARSLGWTVGLTALFALWYAVERWGLRIPSGERLVRNPAMAPMIVLGIPHFLMAALFLATSPRVRTVRGALTVTVLLALGAGLCVVYGSYAASHPRHKIPMAAVSFYFVVHELRDEAWFFRVYGDAPRGVEPARVARFLSLSTTLLLLALLAAGLVGFEAHNDARGRVGPLDLVAPGAGLLAQTALALVALGAVAGALWAAWSRAEPDGLRTWLARTRPLGAVHVVFLAVVLAGALAQTALEAIVLWHVMAWFSFSLFRIDRRPSEGPPPRSWLERAKGTRRGFLALHLGLAFAVLVALVVWTYAQGRSASSPLRAVASPDAFYYWTIMHITVSFFPRGAVEPARAAA